MLKHCERSHFAVTKKFASPLYTYTTLIQNFISIYLLLASIKGVRRCGFRILYDESHRTSANDTIVNVQFSARAQFSDL